MNKKESAQVIAMLKAGYPNFYKHLTEQDAQGIVSMWSMQFAEMPADIVLMALNKAISTNTYPPSIAEVKEKISSVHWEAYEMMSRHYKVKSLSDEEYAYYKRIYDETRAYKFANKVEPSISNMLGGRDVKQLGKGE